MSVFSSLAKFSHVISALISYIRLHQTQLLHIHWQQMPLFTKQNLVTVSHTVCVHVEDPKKFLACWCRPLRMGA